MAILQFHIYPRTLCMTAILGIAIVPAIFCAPHTQGDNVMLNDETFWTSNSNTDSSDSNNINLPSEESKPTASKETAAPAERKSKEWYDATITLFKKWGYKDADIPHPFGSGHPNQPVKLTPEFEIILRGLIEKIPGELERDIQRILDANKGQGGNLQTKVSASATALPANTEKQQEPLVLANEKNPETEKYHPTSKPEPNAAHHDANKEIQELEKLIFGNHASLTEKQLKDLDEEIRLLEDMNEDDHADFRALDDEIDKIKQLTTYPEGLAPTKQKQALDHEIKILQQMTPIEVGEGNKLLDDEILKLEALAHNEGPIVTPSIKEALHDDIKTLEGLENNPRDHHKLKSDLDTEIEQIEKLIHSPDPPTASKLANEMEKLHTIIHDDKEGPQGHSEDNNAGLPKAPSGVHFKTICEDEKRGCPQSTASNAPEVVDYVDFHIIEHEHSANGEESKHSNSVEHEHPSNPSANFASNSASNRNMSADKMIPDDTKAIDEAVHYIGSVLEKVEQGQHVPIDELHHSQTELNHLTNLIHELETNPSAHESEPLAGGPDQQYCHWECEKPKHKTNTQSEIASRNEDMIIKELQSKEPPVDETAPFDVESRLPIAHKFNGNAEQKEEPQGNKEVKDAGHIIQDVENVAKLDRQQAKLTNDTEASSQTQSIKAKKLQNLEKVIHDIHDLATDEADIGGMQNKERLHQLIADLAKSRGPGEANSLEKLEKVLENLEKDSEIEFQLQQKLHHIEDSGAGARAGELKEVINDLHKLDKSNNNLKSSNKDFSKEFELEVNELERSAFNSKNYNTGHSTFDAELQNLKKLSDHHVEIPVAHKGFGKIHEANLNPTQSLEEEIRRLEELTHNQKAISAAQKEGLHEEIKELQILEHRKHVNAFKKARIDDEIANIETLLQGQGKLPEIELDTGIARLHKVVHLEFERPPLDTNEDLLGKEIKQLEIIVKKNGLLFDRNEHSLLDKEIKELHNLELNHGKEATSAQLLALEKEIAKLQDLSFKPYLSPTQRHERVGSLIENLRQIVHPLPDHNFDALKQEIEKLELLTENRIPSFLTNKQNQVLKWEIEKLHSLPEITPPQIEALDREIGKIQNLATVSNNRPPNAYQLHELDAEIKTLQDITREFQVQQIKPAQMTFRSHNFDDLDKEIIKLEALTEHKVPSTLTNKQTHILKLEIEKLHDIPEVSPPQIHALDREIGKIQHLATVTGNHQPGYQLDELDTEIKALQDITREFQVQHVKPSRVSSRTHDFDNLSKDIINLEALAYHRMPSTLTNKQIQTLKLEIEKLHDMPKISPPQIQALDTKIAKLRHLASVSSDRTPNTNQAHAVDKEIESLDAMINEFLIGTPEPLPKPVPHSSSGSKQIHPNFRPKSETIKQEHSSPSQNIGNVVGSLENIQRQIENLETKKKAGDVIDTLGSKPVRHRSKGFNGNAHGHRSSSNPVPQNHVDVEVTAQNIDRIASSGHHGKFSMTKDDSFKQHGRRRKAKKIRKTNYRDKAKHFE